MFYNEYKTKAIDWVTADIKIMLVNGYTQDIDAHSNIGDITGEITGDGYTAGGQALVNKSVARDDTNDLAKYDADDVVWTGTLSATGAVIYLNGSTLIAYIDFGELKESLNDNFIIQWHTNGVFTLG